MSVSETSNDHSRRWMLHLQCLAIAIAAALVVTLLFCPRFGNWKGVVLINGPIATDYGRGVAAFHQIKDPWAPIVADLHRIIAWRLLFPVVWHYLKLPFGLYLAMPHLGCLITLWLTAYLAQKRFGNWFYTWMTVALLATLPWFFVSMGWLGYFDSWFALGMLIVSCVSSRKALGLACLLVPWIDERFVLALPLCMTVRFILLYKGERVLSRELLRDLYVVVIASLVYPAVRIVALLRGDSLTTNYVPAIWSEIQGLSWSQFLDGLWSGYRAAWVMILAGIYFWWRRAGWIWGVGLALIVAVSAVGALFIAADMSRNMMIVLPASVLGIWLWSETQPQIFRWVLPAVLIANMLLPAAHVMWNLKIPIHNYFVARSEPTLPYLDPQVDLQQARDCMDRGEVSKAEILIDVALRLDDRFAPAYISRAIQRSLQGDLTGAKNDIQQALKLTPDSADALFISAVIATRLNDTTAAKADIQKALRNAPPEWPNRFEAKKLLEQVGASAP